jgi:hypothetical protein
MSSAMQELIFGPCAEIYLHLILMLRLQEKDNVLMLFWGSNDL